MDFCIGQENDYRIAVLRFPKRACFVEREATFTDQLILIGEIAAVRWPHSIETLWFGNSKSVEEHKHETSA